MVESEELPGGSGGASGREDLAESIYAELRAQAARCMLAQPPGHTLEATALVHEVYLKLCGAGGASGAGGPAWSDRTRFVATAAIAMRQILVDHARGRARLKRTPPGTALPLDQVLVSYEDRAVDLLALDEALTRLAAFDPSMARAVELRFFGGLSVEETARVLEIPQRTFERHWVTARAWLLAQVS